MTSIHEDTERKADRIRLGKTRVRDASGFTGTVEYVGPVASAKNSTVLYAGIIWDDESRGIHDGSVLCRKTKQMIRHFQAPHPTAGSFIRLTSLDVGTIWTPSMTVRERYVALDSIERVAPNNFFPDHTACTSSGKDDKVIEFIGELKIRSQQQVQDLTQISMRRSGINSMDTKLDWTPLKHVLELDMVCS
jgi:tubulin-specific chaperone E